MQGQAMPWTHLRCFNCGGCFFRRRLGCLHEDEVDPYQVAFRLAFDLDQE